MELLIFAVYDDKAGAYSRPFFMATRGLALRAFADSVNDLSHPIGQHPEDYYLFQAGTFDNASGKLLSDDTLLYVAHGIELRKRVEDIALRGVVPPVVNGGDVPVSLRDG